MRVMVLEPGKLAEVINIRPNEITEIIDGVPKKIFSFSEKIGIYVNKERKGLPLNRAIYNEDGGLVDICTGTMILASEDGDLTDEEIIKLLSIFGGPEKYPNEEEAAELEECLDRLAMLMNKIFSPDKKRNERSAK